MKKIVLLTITYFLLQFSVAEEKQPVISFYLANIIAHQQTKFIPVNTIQKKNTLKEKVLLKYFRKSNEDDRKKKLIKTIGIISLMGSLLAIPLFFIGLFGPFILTFIGLSFSLFAFILGIIALGKRSKLKDKTGTKAWPALLGMIFGIGFLIVITIWVLIVLFGN